MIESVFVSIQCTDVTAYTRPVKVVLIHSKGKKKTIKQTKLVQPVVTSVS